MSERGGPITMIGRSIRISAVSGCRLRRSRIRTRFEALAKVVGPELVESGAPRPGVGDCEMRFQKPTPAPSRNPSPERGPLSRRGIAVRMPARVDREEAVVRSPIRSPARIRPADPLDHLAGTLRKGLFSQRTVRLRPRSPYPVRLLLAALAFIGCGRGEVESDRGRVLLVGVDGASPGLVRAMRASGELPHFESLARAGASGELRSEFPLLSPRIWTTVATGRDPSVHGVESWVWKDEDGSLKLYSSADRDVPAVWNILSEAGLRVGVVNWLMTHPPEKIDGVMISDHALPHIAEKRLGLAGQFAAKMYPEADEPVTAPTRGSLFAYPEEWALRFAGHLQADEALTDIRNPFESKSPDFADLLEGLSRFYQDDQVVTRAALDVEAELDPDLLMVYLPGIDRVSHFLWSAQVPQESLPQALRLPPTAVAQNRESLRDYYRFVDALLGRLLERYGSDDLVLVLSDHGFEAAVRPSDMPGIHDSEDARDGILYARAPGIEAGSTVEGVGIRDVLPTLLAWFGLPLAEDMPGKIALVEAREAAGSVPSYDALRIERVGGVDDEVEDAVVDQLRALGYVD